MAHGVFRTRLLLSAYAPLNLILFVRIEQSLPRFIFLAVAILGFLDANRITWHASRLPTVVRTPMEVREAGAEVAGYLAIYLLPFLAGSGAGSRDVWSYLIYAAILIVISVRSELARVNPSVYVFGWKVVTVEFEDGRTRFLVCRRTPKRGEPLHVSQLFGLLHARN